METVNININSYDKDLDVSHKLNTTEISNWLKHLKFTKEELKGLIKLCSKDLKNKLYDEKILSEFEKKNQENDNFISALNHYKSTREHIAECEDLDCDMVYIKEHEAYRKSYHYHLDKYRKLKDHFYIEVSQNLKKNANKELAKL